MVGEQGIDFRVFERQAVRLSQCGWYTLFSPRRPGFNLRSSNHTLLVSSHNTGQLGSPPGTPTISYNTKIDNLSVTTK
ncbi:hypothetical protein DPMN_147100 [Dreissena polymorpha]|uniref:Uncharacterized protein n=1 Tax=Dreissena polymorpha TaxID=45954 RepID=A0A9D4FBK8_DREPO|nr:hypothetical protein DPMN_147100 [Dreissena polymorpha]